MVLWNERWSFPPSDVLLPVLPLSLMESEEVLMMIPFDHPPVLLLVVDNIAVVDIVVGGVADKENAYHDVVMLCHHYQLHQLLLIHPSLWMHP